MRFANHHVIPTAWLGFYAYSVVTLGEQEDKLRCQRSLRGQELGRAQAN